MKKRIFFDQDGTLVESGPGIKHSARKTLEKRKLPVIPYEELDFFVGPPLRDCFRLCHVPEERIEEACLIYRHFYNEEGGKYDANVYPGIMELLSKLKSGGNLLYIATSKADVLAKDIGKHFGFDKYFDGFFGACLDGSRALKKDILHQGLISTDSSLPAVVIPILIWSVQTKTRFLLSVLSGDMVTKRKGWSAVQRKSVLPAPNYWMP